MKHTHTVVTGMGVITPIGIGKEAFTNGLQTGNTHFSSVSFENNGEIWSFPRAYTADFVWKEQLSRLPLDPNLSTKAKALRHLSQSTAYGTYCALEAWADAALPANTNLTTVAIVASGSNVQQNTLCTIQADYHHRLQHLTPYYGFSFFDTDQVGVLSELLGITGEGHSISAASASGNMGIIQGMRLIQSGEYEVVVVVAPLMDISLYEYQGFTTMGAMAPLGTHSDPTLLCRPFDQAHCGFVYGQCAGCLVLESPTHAARRGKAGYGILAGYGVSLDANRNPNPSIQGECQAMHAALQRAGIEAHQIEYVNTHGTGSVIGDETEVAALLQLGLHGVKANSTKSLTGHGLTAAGMVETIACLIQMNTGFLHKTHNLIQPIHTSIDWICDTRPNQSLHYALNTSFGFGGINTALVLKTA